MRGFGEGGANVLCALVIMVPRDTQGREISPATVRAMGDIARRHGLHTLIAPVRPSWKDRYPLMPIDRYARWRRPDDQLFDPWMRVHERLGATVLKPEVKLPLPDDREEEAAGEVSWDCPGQGLVRSRLGCGRQWISCRGV